MSSRKVHKKFTFRIYRLRVIQAILYCERLATLQNNSVPLFVKANNDST